MDVLALVGWGLLILACVGAVYAAAAAVLVPHFLRREEPLGSDKPAFPVVTILKPLHGEEPGLGDHLATFCLQDYPGAVQIVCGVQDGGDPAAGTVADLQRRFPDRDIALVRDGDGPGANRKIANLVAMMRAVKHEILVLADSDIAVDSDYLARVVAGLAEEGVGAVTCLYRGQAVGGVWSQLSAMAIDHHFLPGIVVGLHLGLAAPCFGSTIAIRRSTLDRIGGFAAFSDRLADDYEIGKVVRRLGLRVAIPSLVVSHTCAERTVKELLTHELRWARTILTVDRLGFLGSGVTHALPLALLGVVFLGGTSESLAVLAIAAAARLWLVARVDTILAANRRSRLLFVARDLLSFFVYCAAFFVRSVTWRDRRFQVAPDRMIAPVEEQ